MQYSVSWIQHRPIPLTDQIVVLNRLDMAGVPEGEVERIGVEEVGMEEVEVEEG